MVLDMYMFMYYNGGINKAASKQCGQIDFQRTVIPMNSHMAIVPHTKPLLLLSAPVAPLMLAATIPLVPQRRVVRGSNAGEYRDTPRNGIERWQMRIAEYGRTLGTVA